MIKKFYWKGMTKTLKSQLKFFHWNWRNKTLEYFQWKWAKTQRFCFSVFLGNNTFQFFEKPWKFFSDDFSVLVKPYWNSKNWKIFLENLFNSSHSIRTNKMSAFYFLLAHSFLIATDNDRIKILQKMKYINSLE